MKNTEEIIEDGFRIYSREQVANALYVNAEQKRIANLIHLKELGYQIPDEAMLYSLVDKATADKIIKDTKEMRLDMGNHR